MKKFFLLLLIVFLSGFGNASFVLAQEAKDCFDYYPYGKVSFEWSTDKGEYLPGEKVYLAGSLVNSSETPIADASILAQLRFVTLDSDGNILTRYLLDSKKVADNLRLKADGTTAVKADYQIPDWAPKGSYTLSFYLIQSGQYNIAGLPFIPNVPGDLQIISVGSLKNFSIPFFDINKASVNGQTYSINLPSVQLDSLPVSIKIPLINPSSSVKNVKVIKTLYHWDDSNPKNAISSVSEEYSLKAKASTEVLSKVDNLEPGTYMAVFAVRESDGSQTVERVRFSLPGQRLRLIYSGVAQDERGVVSCVANETRQTEDAAQNKLKITLSDGDGDTLVINKDISDFDPEVRSITSSIDSSLDLDGSYSIKTQLLDEDGKILEETKTSFLSESEERGIPDNIWWLIGAVVVAILILVSATIIIKR